MREEFGSGAQQEGKAWAGPVGLEVCVKITVPVSECLLYCRPLGQAFHKLPHLVLMIPLGSRDLLFVYVFQMGKLRLREVRSHAQGPTARVAELGLTSRSVGLGHQALCLCL